MRGVRALHLRPRASARQRRPAPDSIFLLLASLLLATGATGQPLETPGRPLDRVEVRPQEERLELSWSDTEDRLQGSVRPVVPRAGEPLHVVLHVGSFEGAEFDGPVTLSLREQGATHASSVTVTRDGRYWRASFTPEGSGPYLLDMSFRTTRHKLLHAPLRVEPSPELARLLLWSVLGAGLVLLLGYSVRNLLREGQPGKRAPEAPSGEEPPAPR